MFSALSQATDEAASCLETIFPCDMTSQCQFARAFYRSTSHTTLLAAFKWLPFLLFARITPLGCYITYNIPWQCTHKHLGIQECLRPCMSLHQVIISPSSCLPLQWNHHNTTSSGQDSPPWHTIYKVHGMVSLTHGLNIYSTGWHAGMLCCMMYECFHKSDDP